MLSTLDLLSIVPYPKIDPILFAIGSFSVRWYGLAYLGGLLFGLLYARKIFDNQFLGTAEQRRLNSIYRERAYQDHCVFWIACGVIVGGRLGYVLFYDFSAAILDPLRSLKIWNGGMSFHGGFIGVVLVLIFMAYSKKISIWTLSDVVAAVAPIGIFLGRFANFINDELWGRPSVVPWAMVFPSGGEVSRHPSQYEAILEGIVLFLILYYLIYFKKALKIPGLVSSTFVCVYAFFRIFVEFFREPDVQLGYIFGDWVTMGMVLSFPMMIIGLLGVFQAISSAK
ncbi:LOW QUALITY PROTEIN: Prolipoprotein diacylglyceryl transferase [Liberibacter crescens BT-1]|uniref:Phosphatidylglycerol--prolipoprotein diacylglyceryl transferase n=1 Tax=Liberibacter crescens (strain BT-1) TaxID=1215343 RepID=L0EUK0_LIBCB|nr:LOW QUALITY PROTEIN: Prolipoprotein diacylglyceryl transferase [Liberibacter crescens BT-1]